MFDNWPIIVLEYLQCHIMYQQIRQALYFLYRNHQKAFIGIHNSPFLPTVN